MIDSNSVTTTPPEKVELSLYEQFGGEEFVEKVVDAHYKLMTGDPDLMEFFQGISLASLMHHERHFMAVGLGGPNNYKGKDMRTAHQHLKLEYKHFDIGIGHLGTALLENGVSQEQVKAWRTKSERLRTLVLNR